MKTFHFSIAVRKLKAILVVNYRNVSSKILNTVVYLITFFI